MSANEELITSAEAFQEIIHRYKALHDNTHLQAAYEALEELVDNILPVTKSDLDIARSYVSQFSSLSSRDCLHAAIMKSGSCKKIWTYDQKFEVLPKLIRIF